MATSAAIPEAKIVGWYSVRVTNPNYTGPLFRVRRDSDDASALIGASGYSLDIAALEAFCSGANGFVETWFDQSGRQQHLEQTADHLQPQLVQDGSVCRDADGNPAVLSVNREIKRTLDVSVSNGDLTAIFVYSNETGHVGSAAAYPILIGGSSTFAVRMESGDVAWLYGAGGARSTAEGGNGPNYGYFHFSPAIFSFTASAADALLTARRNGVIHQTYTIPSPENVTITGALQIGTENSSTGYVCEVLVFKALTEAEDHAVTDALNMWYQVGPDSSDLETTIAFQQTEKWHPPMYRFLKSITPSMVDYERGRAINWDGNWSDIDELHLVNMIWSGSEYDPDMAFRAEPEMFVLDDGRGGGAEASDGNIRHFRPGNNNGSHANQIAAMYALSMVNQDGTQANPYYGDRKVAMRALVCAALNLFGHDKLALTNWSYSGEIDFHGGAMLGSAYAYRVCKDELDATTNQAFIDAFQWYITKFLAKGAHGINSNMDCKSLAAVGYIYEFLDATHKDRCVRAMKRLLFGSETGTAATSNDEGLGGGYGIYAKFGGIIEGGSPETTYVGQSTKYLSQLWAFVRDYEEWQWLRDVLVGVGNWYCYFIMPEGLTGELDGPAGFAGRTAGTVWTSDQGSNFGMKRAVLAADIEECLPFARYKLGLNSAAEMVTDTLNRLPSAADFASETIYGEQAAHTNGINYALTCYGDPATDEIVINESHNLTVGLRVGFYSDDGGGGVPEGLNDDTAYWVVNVSGPRIQVSATEGGVAKAITDAGTNVRTAAILQFDDVHDMSDQESNPTYYRILIDDEWRYMRLVDNTEKWAMVRSPLSISAGSPVDYQIAAFPQNYVWNGSHWPKYGVWQTRPGTYETLYNLVNTQEPNTYLPWERPITFSKNYADDIFQCKQQDADGRYYGMTFFCFLFPGQYDGWYSGEINVWLQNHGHVILCKHDKSGSDPSENTRVWSKRDLWAMTHVHGLDNHATTKLGFSTAATDGPSIIRSNTIDTVNKRASYKVRIGCSGTIDKVSKGQESVLLIDEENIVHTNGVATRTLTLTGSPDLSSIDTASYNYIITLDDGVYRIVASVDDVAKTVTLDASEAEETIAASSPENCKLRRVPIIGWLDHETIVQDISNGWDVEVNVTSSGDDPITQLWYSIPIPIRGTAQTTDGSVSYWNGGTWLPLTTTPISMKYIRQRRVDNSGNVTEAFLTFDTPQLVATAGSIYEQAYQETTRIQILNVNILGADPNTEVTMPTAVPKIKYKVTTEALDLDPSAPIAALTFPSGGATLPVGEPYAAQASASSTVGGLVVELEASTNNGSSYTTVGTMQDVGGGLFEYVGGSVPTGLTNLRVKATDNLGVTDSGTQITVTSTTYSTVHDDQFNAANGTLVNGSYTSWESSSVPGAGVYINSGTIIPEVQSLAFTQPTQSDNGFVPVGFGFGGINTSVIVQADVKANRTTARPRASGVFGRARSSTMTYEGVRLLLKDTIGGSGSDWALEEYSGGGANGTTGGTISGFSASTFYRLKLEFRNNITVYTISDTSDTVLVQGAVFGSFHSTDSSRDVFGIGTNWHSADGTAPEIDNFLIKMP